MMNNGITENIRITNWMYQVNGKRFWFASLGDAICALANNHPMIYKNCLDPFLYVKEIKTNLYSYGKITW